MKLFSLALLLTSKCVAAEIEVTGANYAYAETQRVFLDLLKKLKWKWPGTSGTGRFAHSENTTNPRDGSIPRPNFDTLYSAAFLDLTEPATLTIENTGRYQSVLIVTENHWMPTFFINTEPGTYQLTENDLGDKYVMALARTLVDTNDYEDVLEAYRVQELLQLSQADVGMYEPEEEWDEDTLEEKTIYYINMSLERVITSGEMYGPNDGTITEDNHNVGVAIGWGANPPERAVYENYYASSTGPYTLLLKNIPVRAFWSTTIYDYKGFVVPTNVYHVNSGFAVENDDGSVTINFIDERGSNKVSGMSNVVDVYPGWNFVLRLYEPEDEILEGSWVRPEIKKQKCKVDDSKSKCEKKGCQYAKNKETKEKECGYYPSDPKKLCQTFLSKETCNNAEGICLWDKKKESCGVYKCKTAKKDSDCVGDCTWKKGKCKNI